MTLHELLFGFDPKTKAKHPHLFTDHNIDRHTCSRVKPMQVLSLGMGRTGTASIKAALTKLGYSTSHGFDMHSNPKDMDMWNEAFDAKFYNNPQNIALDATFWDKLLGHVSAVTDTPANIFSRELIASYPRAKIILVQRDVETWYPSFENAVISGTDHPWALSIFGFLDDKMSASLPLLFRGIMGGQFRAKDSGEFRRNARVVYREHYEEIRGLVKGQEGRLLEFKLEDGWGPLCEFLGKDVPEVPFPRVNETEMHEDMLRVVYLQMTRRSVGKLIKWMAPFLVSYVTWRWWPGLLSRMR